MKRTQNQLRVCFLFVLTVCFGCAGNRQIVSDPAPVLLRPDASLQDVIGVLNANTDSVSQLQSINASLQSPGLPRLNATFALQRPRNFRLRAETNLTGTELDLGSNDQIYWVWVRQNAEPVVYWGRHDQFHQSMARSVLPVSPDWIIDAIGLVRLDPEAVHQGPIRTAEGRLELRSQVQTASGPLTRVLIVDDTRGWVLEQHLLDTQDQLIASSVSSGFQYDPVHRVSLPRDVAIRLPPAQMEFTIRTERYLINQLAASSPTLWTMPQIPGHRYLDLGTQPAGSPQGSLLQPSSNRRWQQPPPTTVRPRTASAIRRLPPFDRLR